ncbi:SCO2523 family variant P-loop protein [Streptomyces sp. S.PB5]|uniref:SCO2523 family variant P-loop protein n=1 Tax=Streptomyces sp. S.PB5 TaxID=3020844 RepID=UPI0025AED323|nr:SCO2523 family variant P-loop protein [Streptomyces sp. S.PB5]MDN3028387.1 SCO2523 family variant P-loop protein [Streptomyces sp. S.PB5]
MIVFAASDKGGTGRSVTSANLAYQRALAGDHVAYVDFDFGSPTAPAVFDVPDILRGTGEGGLHSYLEGTAPEPARVDVWRRTEHPVLRRNTIGAGRLVLLPGDVSGGEFVTDEDSVQRCVNLFLRLHGEFDLILVDLSAGRSYAMDMVLEATARPELRNVPHRWVVFHRWTRQHVIAAAGLVYAARGLLEGGAELGHDKDALRAVIRFVRAAVPDPDSSLWSHVSPAQSAWMQMYDERLRRLASELGVGDTVLLGTVPLEPILQWREQLITEEEVVATKIANKETLDALEAIAGRLTDDTHWGKP